MPTQDEPIQESETAQQQPQQAKACATADETIRPQSRAMLDTLLPENELPHIAVHKHQEALKTKNSTTFNTIQQQQNTPQQVSEDEDEEQRTPIPASETPHHPRTVQQKSTITSHSVPAKQNTSSPTQSKETSSDDSSNSEAEDSNHEVREQFKHNKSSRTLQQKKLPPVTPKKPAKPSKARSNNTKALREKRKRSPIAESTDESSGDEKDCDQPAKKRRIGRPPQNPTEEDEEQPLSSEKEDREQESETNNGREKLTNVDLEEEGSSSNAIDEMLQRTKLEARQANLKQIMDITSKTKAKTDVTLSHSKQYLISQCLYICIVNKI